MKSIFATLLLLVLSITAGFGKVITSPRCETRSTTRVKIDSIDFRENLTRIYLTCNDLPSGWMVFSNDICLQNGADGTKWTAIDIDGADFDRRFIFPESGTVAVNIDFPPLPNTLATVDLIQQGENQPWRIVNIDLSGAAAPSPLLPEWLYGNWLNDKGDWEYGFYDRFLLADNRFWSYDRIRTVAGQLLLTVKDTNGASRELRIQSTQSGRCIIGSGSDSNNAFFKGDASPVRAHNTPITAIAPQADSATLRGVIAGYHPRLGFKSGTLFLDNVITRQEETVIVPIDSLGRFEKKIELHYPIQQTLYLPTGYLNFYLEPGSELTVYAEMEQLAAPVRSLDEVENQLTHTLYMGRLGSINQELKEIRISRKSDSLPLLSDLQNLTAETFRAKHQKIYRQNIKNSAAYSSLCRQLVSLNELYSYGRKMLDYELYRRNKQLPFQPTPSFYSFLQELPLDDFHSLTAAEYKLFIAGLEKISPFQNYKPTAPELLRAFEEQGTRLSDDEREFIVFSLEMKNYSDTARLSDYSRRLAGFNSKYRETQSAIREQLILKNKHQVWTQSFGLNPSITFELLFSRQFIPRYSFMKRALTDQEFVAYTQYIRQPMVRQLVSQLNHNFTKK